MKTTFGAIGFLLVLALAVCAGLGWVFNIVHFIQHVNQPFNGTEWVRLAGIPIAIIGCVLGWFV